MKKEKTNAGNKVSISDTGPFMGASLYYGDCLGLMDEWVEHGYACAVDLIYLDPPFNSKSNYNILFGESNGVSAQVMAFEDTWTWDDKAEVRLEDLDRGKYPDKLKNTLTGLQEILGKAGMLAYLTYMAQRLQYCWFMMKDTGTIYLHCDPTASHYLKILMDSVFGADNFRNEIVWCCTEPSYTESSEAEKNFSQKHDIILRYTKSNVWTFNGDAVKVPYVKRDTGNTKGIFKKRATLRESGKIPETWWSEIPPVEQIANEQIGYPTQKPIALLKRIIASSSNKGDVVLDPFCGCGTSVVAANAMGRRWCGIDISAFPVELIRLRLHDIRDKIKVDGIPCDMDGARMLAEKPFEFEKWAVMQIPGLLPNTEQTGDGSVDGGGWLENDIEDAIKPPAAKTPAVIVQVAKSVTVNLDKIRALAHSMEAKNALFGVYLTLEQIDITKSIRDVITAAGSVEVGTRKYQRLQLYSISEFFDGKKVDLPLLSTPQALLLGGDGARIIQGQFGM